MHDLVAWMLAIMMLLGVPTIVSSQTSPLVDAEAGAAAIRLFEGDPTMVVPAPRRVNPGRESFLYALADGRRYEVDVRTGKVWRAGYPEPHAGAGVKISRLQAEQVARQYATKHFAVFMGEPMNVRVSGGGQIYTVVFRQNVPTTGAALSNYVLVVVHRVSGAVILASIRDESQRPAGSALGPAVDQEQAVRNLARVAGMIAVRSVRSANLRWARHDGEDLLVWSLTLDGVFPGEIRGFRGGAVDARTGRVISVRRPESADYRIVKGADGSEVMEIAQGPAVPAAGSLDGGGGSSSGGLPAAAAMGLVSAAVLAVAAAAFMLRRRRRAPVAGPQTGHPV